MKNFRVSKEKSDIHKESLHHYLSVESYWAKDRSMETIEQSIQNSICYSAILNDTFIGFARIITDKSTFAYLSDFFILPDYQKNQYGTMMLNFILNDTDINGIRIYLLTLDGHEFYKKFGFSQDTDLLKRIMRKMPAKT